MIKRTAQSAELAERNAKIKEAFASGTSTYREIGKQFGLTPLRVKDIVRDPFAAIAPEERTTEYEDFVPSTDFTERATQMNQLRDNGLTLEEIGKLFGVTRERVRQIISNPLSTQPKPVKPPKVETPKRPLGRPRKQPVTPTV